MALRSGFADKDLVACKLSESGWSIHTSTAYLARRNSGPPLPIFEPMPTSSSAMTEIETVEAELPKGFHDATLLDLCLNYERGEDQVVAFLEPSHAEVYADRSAWDAMQEDVVARLEALG